MIARIRKLLHEMAWMQSGAHMLEMQNVMLRQYREAMSKAK